MFCKNSVKWLYRLDRNYSWESGYNIPEDRIFLDSSGKVRLVLEKGGLITVTRGYSWNGCSPKMCFVDLLIGTPEGVVHAVTGRPKTYYASMVHDALYQFLKTGSSLTRKQADEAFLRLMGESDFIWRWIYWAAVRVLGCLVWKGKSKRRKWRGHGVSFDSLMGGHRSILGASETPKGTALKREKSHEYVKADIPQEALIRKMTDLIKALEKIASNIEKS